MNPKQLAKRIDAVGNPLLLGLAPLIAEVVFPLVAQCLGMDLSAITGRQRAKLEASIKAKLRSAGKPSDDATVSAAAHALETMARDARPGERAKFLKSAEAYLTV
jgi:hypothetical protein